MKKLNKSDFNRKIKEIEIPELDATVTIKSLSASVVLECQEYLKSGDQAGFAFAMFVNSVLDDDGKLMFTREEAEELDYSVLDRIVLEVMDFNGIAPDMVKVARQQLKNRYQSSMQN